MARRRSLGWFVLALLAVEACTPAPRTADDWPGDPQTPEQAATMCRAAGARLLEFKCSSDDAKYAEACEFYVANGVPMHPQCVMAAKSCAEADRC